MPLSLPPRPVLRVSRLSILARLSVLALALTVPILVFAGVLLWQYGSESRRHLEREADNRARAAAASIDQDVAGLIATLETLGLAGSLQRGDLATFRAQMAALRQRTGLDALLRAPDGTVLAGEPEAGAGRLDGADRAALDGRRAVVSDVLRADPPEASRFRIVAPVLRAGSGEVLFLLSLELPVERLRTLLLADGLPASWVATVFDRGDRILARTRAPDRYVGSLVPQSLRERATGSGGSWSGDSMEGEPVFVTYARAPRSGLRVAVGVPFEALAAPVRASVLWFAGLGLALAALAAVLALAVARHIAAPLRGLAAQAAALGRGEAVRPLADVPAEIEAVSAELARAGQIQRERAGERERAAATLREETQRLEVMNRVGLALSSELDRQRLGQAVIEAATRLTGAAYGALFERVPASADAPERWHLLSLAGAPLESFTRFGLPRATGLFAPTFRADGPVRSDDILADPRYGSLGGMPQGHLPVRSYLALPVVSRTGTTLGALLFGHPEPRRFGDREESLVAGLAGQAAVALDNAALFESVRRSQDRFAAAVQAVRGVLWTNDASGRMAGDQPGWSALTGQGLQQYRGYGWAEAVHPEDRAASIEAWNAAVAGRRLFAHEHRVRRHDGIWRTFAIKAVPVVETDGTIREWVGVHTDITEQRAAEAALRDSNDEIQRYAYIVSHDLRAPLVNIMGFTSEIEASRAEIAAALAGHPEAGRIDADLAESLGFIKAAITKMDGLINAILRLSREGRRSFHPEPLDMTAVMRDLADAQRHQAGAAGASVEIRPLPEIVADRVAVGQIFGNLLDNAIKYLEDGRPGRITVTGEVVEGQAVFRVADNGRGIAASDHARVFELFRRSGRQDRPGEGIGLAHVRTLARALGGQIDLASVVGAGTTFTVTLPLRQP